ncbi:MAG: hypothetical protein ACI9CD_000598 [Candidatus Deianiraeaceae bacterium]|jgi:hypothetical protein
MYVWVRFCVSMIIHWFKKDKKESKFTTQQELIDNARWEYLNANNDIMDYSIAEAQALFDILYNSIDTVRNKTLSILHYLFIVIGGILYTFLVHSDKLNAIHNKYPLMFLAGYISSLVVYIAYTLILPSQNIPAKYTSPLKLLPLKTDQREKTLNEIKISQLLSLQDGIEKLTKITQEMQNNMRSTMLELSFVLIGYCFVSLLIYFGFFFVSVADSGLYPLTMVSLHLL